MHQENPGSRIVAVKLQTLPGLELHIDIGSSEEDEFDRLTKQLAQSIRRDTFRVYSDYWGRFVPSQQSSLFYSHVCNGRFEILFDTYTDA